MTLAATRSTPQDQAEPATGLRTYVSLARDLRAGIVTPRAYLEDCLDRIAKHDPRIGAFVALNVEGARQAADAASARWRDGKPLSAIDGMPLAVKDVIETADMPTGQGSPMWEGSVTRRNSAAVRALREAGGVILGKTTTTEFAATHPWHKTQNPHDGTRTPGGSSSGSAAAVGAGMVPVGLGTQVVGSILRPSSFCGCVGYKPSVGGVNRSGSYDHFSQSCQGAIGATVADVWATIITITERTGGDPGKVGVSGRVNFATSAKPKRLAILETGGWSATTEGARKTFAAARDKLAATGVELKSRADDPDLEAAEQHLVDALPLTQSINAFEGRWPLNTYAALDAGTAQRTGIGPPEDSQRDDTARLRRTAQASRRRTCGIWQSRAALRRFCHARRLRRRAEGPWLDRQHHHERRRLAARLPGDHAAAALRRELAARPATDGRCRS